MKKKIIKAWMYTWPDGTWQIIPKRLSKGSNNIFKLKETVVEIIHYLKVPTRRNK